MPSVHDIFSEQFHQWEVRGRGWRVFPYPVRPEPPFVPFPGFNAAPLAIPDDGRRPTFLSSLVQGLSRRLANVQEPEQVPPEKPEPEGEKLERRPAAELQLTLPKDFEPPRDAVGQFVQSVSLSPLPVAFELLGTSGRVTSQFAADPADLPRIRRHLEAIFPELILTETEDALARAWSENGDEAMIVEFGLANEFVLPLHSPRLDPFVGLVAALSDLRAAEVGLFQVLFQPVTHPWGENILKAVVSEDNRPTFKNVPVISKAAAEKATQSLFAAVVRIAISAKDFERITAIGVDLASALRVFADPNGNELVPLENTDYQLPDHEADLVLRQSRRSGMILALDELTAFVHIPSAEVRSPKLARQLAKTKVAPQELQADRGLLLGHNSHAGRTVEVRLSPEARARHMLAIGASGTGKSTFLFNLICQDIQEGEGVAVLDPHGDLVDKILGQIPKERIDDVILIDPSDSEYSVGFNILSAHSELEKNLLASDLVSVFQRLSSSWGDQMTSVLRNAITAFLESPRAGTLADLRRFLLETEFRNEFLKTVTDTDIVYYWRKGFAQLSGNKSIGPLLTRLDTFLSPKAIRHMVSQPVNRLDFASIMDTGKIFLAKLSQGLIGRENSYLLGSLLVSKFQQTAMSRQAQSVRRAYWLYIDEFQNFVTPSMAEILTGARKYRLGLILANQELRQLERERDVASAVFGCHTRVVFRVGDDDARKLGDGFAFFEARDIQNLEIGQAVCRVERSDHDFNLSVVPPTEEKAEEAFQRKNTVIDASRKKYGTPRSDIESAIHASAVQVEPEVPKPSSRRRPKAESRPEDEAVLPPPPPPIPAPPRPVQAVEPVRPPPADMGRGGAQHKVVQDRVKAAAEKAGFRAITEKKILGGQGFVDVLLERPPRVIACEVSVTTTIDHEIGNVTKCLKAEIPEVAVICPGETRLGKIRAAVEGCLDKVEAAKVKYYTPDSFEAYIGELPLETAPPPDQPERRRGYIVRRHGPHDTPEEYKAKESAAHKIMAQVMRQKKKK